MNPEVIDWQCGKAEALKKDIEDHDLNPDQPDKDYFEPRPSRKVAAPTAAKSFIERIVPGEFYEAHALWNVEDSHHRLLVLPQGNTDLRWAWHIATSSGNTK